MIGSFLAPSRNQSVACTKNDRITYISSLCTLLAEGFWKNDIDHPMSLIRIFPLLHWLQDKVQPSQSTTKRPYSSDPQLLILALFSTIYQYYSSLFPSEFFPFHSISFPVPYPWNTLPPIQPNLQVTSSFPKSIRLCSYQNEYGLWTKTDSH